MKRAWQVASLAFVALAAFMLVKSFEYPFIDRLGPGPGFFPVWLSIATGALAVMLFLQVSLAKGSEVAPGTLVPERSGAVRVLLILVGLVLVLPLLDPLGFRIALFLFLVFLPPALGVRNWWLTLIIALAGSFGVFHVFYYWLKLPLPIGMLGI